MMYKIVHATQPATSRLVDRYMRTLNDPRPVDADVSVVNADEGIIEAPAGFRLRGFGPLAAVPID